MTHEEYRERAHAIEARANERLQAARAGVRISFVSRRLTRYSGGMEDVLRDMAIANEREAIELQMHQEMDALDSEFYSQER